MARNILITGVPRGGTTLAASILDVETDSVCLNEPEWQRPHPKFDAEGFVQAIADDFERAREFLLAGKPIPDKRGEQGEALTNYYGTGIKTVQYPLVREGLSPDFTLGMKHNGPYLGVLPQLCDLQGFEVWAVIRNPLHVLRSWRRLDLPVSRGKMPNATAYWPMLQHITEMKIDVLEKQVRMLEAIFSRIRVCEGSLRLMRYEEFAVHKDAQASAKETPEDGKIMEALRQFAPDALHYYPL